MEQHIVIKLVRYRRPSYVSRLTVFGTDLGTGAVSTRGG